ncbi:hypothetical protein LL912_00930 [Niabella sp. CC-SYL272]|uniref:hypothetical protein n=1 Tax=Niabella agricola TaxID=2891571 RepID=UPI001F44908A|nr:hypothetical protein [Niabella agricola]MCF3107331.1 hypothetical protein [Niabella agricola]
MRLILGILMAILLIGCSSARKFNRIADNTNDRKPEVVIRWFDKNYPNRITGVDSADYLYAVHVMDSLTAIRDGKLRFLDSVLSELNADFIHAKNDTTKQGLQSQVKILSSQNKVLSQKIVELQSMKNDPLPPVKIKVEDSAKIKIANIEKQNVIVVNAGLHKAIDSLKIKLTDANGKNKALKKKYKGTIPVPVSYFIIGILLLGGLIYLKIRFGALSSLIGKIK